MQKCQRQQPAEFDDDTTNHQNWRKGVCLSSSFFVSLIETSERRAHFQQQFGNILSGPRHWNHVSEILLWFFKTPSNSFSNLDTCNSLDTSTRLWEVALCKAKPHSHGPGRVDFGEMLDVSMELEVSKVVVENCGLVKAIGPFFLHVVFNGITVSLCFEMCSILFFCMQFYMISSFVHTCFTTRLFNDHLFVRLWRPLLPATSTAWSGTLSELRRGRQKGRGHVVRVQTQSVRRTRNKANGVCWCMLVCFCWCVFLFEIKCSPIFKAWLVALDSSKVSLGFVSRCKPDTNPQTIQLPYSTAQDVWKFHPTTKESPRATVQNFNLIFSYCFQD